MRRLPPAPARVHRARRGDPPVRAQRRASDSTLEALLPRSFGPEFLPERLPRLGIILGSGLGAIADALTDATHTPYAELEGFPQPSVAGHGGTLHRARSAGSPVAIFQGRKHVYETGDAYGMTRPDPLAQGSGRGGDPAHQRRRLAQRRRRPRPPDGDRRPHQPARRQPAHGPQRRRDRPALPEPAGRLRPRAAREAAEPPRAPWTSSSPKASTSPPPAPRSRPRPRSARSARSAPMRSGCLRFPR